MLDLKSNHVLRLYLHEFPYLRVKRFDTFFLMLKFTLHMRPAVLKFSLMDFLKRTNRRYSLIQDVSLNNFTEKSTFP